MIHGLSNRRRLPRAGKIKLGVLVQPPHGKPYPRATDYLVCPPDVQKVFGEKPTELSIMFPTDDPEVLFPQQLKAYKKSGGLFCAGDGQVAKRWSEDGDLKECACPCPMLEAGECKAIATLNFLLPDIPGAGVWQISSSSERSIIALNSALESFAKMFGGLRGIPFILKLEAERVQRIDEATKKPVMTTVHTLRLDTAYTLRQIVEWRSKLGKPVEALMPASDADVVDATALPAAPEPEGEAVARAGNDRPPSEDDPWDLSLCIAKAKALGVEQADYDLYLRGVYGAGLADLPSTAITEQERLLRDAARSPQAAAQLAQAMRTVAKRVRDGKVKNGATTGPLFREGEA